MGALLGIWEARGSTLLAPFHFDDGAESWAMLLFSVLFHAVIVAIISSLASLIVPRRGGEKEDDETPDRRAFPTDWSVPIFLSIGLPVLAYLTRPGVSLKSPAGIGVLAAGILAILLVSTLSGRLLSRLMDRNRSWGTGAIMLVAGILLLSFFGTLSDRDRFSAARGSSIQSDRLPINLLLITIDTLRPDFLGCYGNPVVRTPHIDRLAREGVQFDEVRSSIPITLPSHTTLLSGVHPLDHGLTDNGQLVPRDELPLLQEGFRSAGYGTAAFVAAFPLDSYFGLDRGFDHYDDDFECLSLRTIAGRVLEYGSLGAITSRFRLRVPTHQVSERNAEAVTASALAWLTRNGDAPFFLWVHFYDPHAPYEAPPPYPSMYETRQFGEEARPITGVEIPRYARLESAGDLRIYRASYAAEVSYTDRSVGELMGALDRLHLTGRTRVVLISDHGEGLGDHDVMTHTSRLHDEQLRVPLIVRDPREPDHSVAANQGGGYRLRAIGDAGIAAILNPPFADPIFSRHKETAGGEPHIGFTPVAGGQTSIQVGRMKLIRSNRDGTMELFDLSSDPGESRNLIARPDHFELIDLLAHQLDERMDGVGGETPDNADLPGGARERLRALGYLGGN